MKGINLSKANLDVNNPLPKSMGEEIRKCTRIMERFVKPEKGKVAIDKVIPKTVIANAKVNLKGAVL